MIKLLSPDDRPREKMLTKGHVSLSNAELLAILIGSGTREKSAVELCREILLAADHDLNKLARMTVHDLMKFKGIGEAKAITIAASLELARRKKNEHEESPAFVRSSKDAFQAVSTIFQDLNHEEFYIILLSRANKILSVDLISKGGLTATVADGKIIFKKALEKGAAALILSHNHPSGSMKPSESDIDLTNRMKSFGKMIDLPVLDHIIVADQQYFSMADNGMI